MAITFANIGNKEHWQGVTWSVDDEGEIASLVARIALGQSQYVRRVLQETGTLKFSPAKTAVAGAIRLLSVADPSNPWHRDGWLFQSLSWIAANLQNDGRIIAPPHMIHAHKGFDGLHVKIDPETNAVLSIIICEEKATDNPRRMIKSRVWKEFAELQEGIRDNEIIAEIGRLLSHSQEIDADKAIEQIFWKEARAYRVSITIDDKYNSTVGYNKLFKGYSKAVDGDKLRRRGEVLYLDDLRTWMDSIAEKAVAELKAIGPLDNVRS